MAIYPAFITPSTVTLILYLLTALTVPVAVIALIVWFMRKMNRIEKSLQGILEQKKVNGEDNKRD